MVDALQPLFVLAHRLVEAAGRLSSITVRTIVNNIDESRYGAASWDTVLDHLHWAPISAAVLVAVSFVGFLLLVRYLQSSDRRVGRSYSPHTPSKPGLSAFDIFISVAMALIGFTVCWATG